MRRQTVGSLTAIVMFLGVPTLAIAQLGSFRMIPGPTAKNLQVLPKTASGPEIDKVMGDFTTQLGVKCVFCHVDKFPEKDDRPHKADARRMMRMVADLNAKKTEYFGPRAKDNLVTCATCHRGKAEPAPFVK